MHRSIRLATENEAPLLTELALRSKGHWRYDPAFLEACRIELTITRDFVVSHPVFILEENETVIGFYSLEGQSEGDVELMHLFIEPEAIGMGHGKLLWDHAVETAAQLGFRTLVISSDPYAEEFYKTMGAIRVGEIPSFVQVGRMLPMLRFTLPLSRPSVL